MTVRASPAAPAPVAAVFSVQAASRVATSAVAPRQGDDSAIHGDPSVVSGGAGWRRAGVSRARCGAGRPSRNSGHHDGRRRATQTTASSPVVCGEKLKMPLSRVAYQRGRVERVGDVPRQVVEARAGCRPPGGRARRTTGRRRRPGSGSAPVQVKKRLRLMRDRAAVDEVAEDDGGARCPAAAPSSGCQVEPARSRVDPPSVRVRPEEQCGLEALAADGQDGDHDQRPPAASAAASIWPRSSPARRAGGAGHPEDHPGDEGRRRRSTGCRRSPPGPRRSGCAGRRTGAKPKASEISDRDPDTEPDPGQQVATVGLHQVGDQDADDQGRLEALHAGRSGSSRAQRGMLRRLVRFA